MSLNNHTPVALRIVLVFKLVLCNLSIAWRSHQFCWHVICIHDMFMSMSGPKAAPAVGPMMAPASTLPATAVRAPAIPASPLLAGVVPISATPALLI